ncbi:MAG: site-2 protease family protein [Subdoligranulum sp.]
MNHFALNGVISPQELYYYALRAVAMLIVIPFHESAHALISWKLGDSTAKDMGRLSMNPLRHFDPLGALCMIAAGVGWAKPVGINPTRFKILNGDGCFRRGGALSNFCWPMRPCCSIKWYIMPAAARRPSWCWISFMF